MPILVLPLPERKKELEVDATIAATVAAIPLAEKAAQAGDIYAYITEDMTLEEAAYYVSVYNRHFIKSFKQWFEKEAQSLAMMRSDILENKKRKEQSDV